MAWGGDRGRGPGRNRGDLSPREPAGLGSGGDGRGVSWGWGRERWAAGVSERSGAGEACGRPGGCKGAKSRGFSAGCSGLCHGVRAAAGSCPRVMPPVWPRQGAPSRVSVCRRPARAGGAGSPPWIPRPGRQPGSVADGVGGRGEAGSRASEPAGGRRSHAHHEFMNCRCVCLEPGSRALGESSLSFCLVFTSREVRIGY